MGQRRPEKGYSIYNPDGSFRATSEAPSEHPKFTSVRRSEEPGFLRDALENVREIEGEVDSMSAKELKDAASELGVKGRSKLKGPELREAVKSALDSLATGYRDRLAKIEPDEGAPRQDPPQSQDFAGSGAIGGAVKKIAEPFRRSEPGRWFRPRVKEQLEEFGEPGQILSRGLTDYSTRSHIRGSEALAKAEATWSDLKKADREVLGRLVDGQKVEGATPDLKARAATLKEVLDAPQLEAISMKLRTNELKGTALPTRVLRKYRKQLIEDAKKAGFKGRRAEEVAEALEKSDLERGSERKGEDGSEPVTEAELKKMRDFMASKEGYLEGSREGIEDHMRNWDVAEVVPDSLFRAYERIESAREFGAKGEIAEDALVRLRSEEGASEAEQAWFTNYIRTELGAKPRRGGGTVQAWSKSQTAMKLGSPISWIKNATQPLLTSGNEARGAAFMALASPKGLPLGFTEALLVSNGLAKKVTGREIPDFWGLRKRMADLVAEGAVPGKRGMAEYADQSGGRMGAAIDKAADLSLAGFSAVEALNQGRAALMAKESMQRDMKKLFERHAKLVKEGHEGIELVKKLDKLASARRVKKRLRITDEQLIDKLVKGERLSGREMQEVVHRTVTDTQFVMNAATQPLFWHNPYYRALMKFKPFTLNQLRWIGQNAVAEARRGNPGPFANLAIWGMVGQELIYGLKDLIAGSDQSVAAKLDEGVPMSELDIMAELGSSMISGGGVPIADFAFGVGDWLAGPAGSNFADLSKLAVDSVFNEGIDGKQLSDFVQSEVSLIGVVEDANPLNLFAQGDTRTSYENIRNAAFDARDKIEGEKVNPLQQFVSDALSPQGFGRTPMSLPYANTADLVSRGRTEEAAEEIAKALENAKGPEDLADRIKGFRRQVSTRGPLAPLPRKHWGKGKDIMGERLWGKALDEETAFRDRYSDALTEGYKLYQQRESR